MSHYRPQPGAVTHTYTRSQSLLMLVVGTLVMFGVPIVVGGAILWAMINADGDGTTAPGVIYSQGDPRDEYDRDPLGRGAP